jgi:hypothetical protein
VFANHTAHHDGLMSSEAPADSDLIAFPDAAVRLRALAVHFELPALARTLRFRARSEETRHVQPHVQSYGVH